MNKKTKAEASGYKKYMSVFNRSIKTNPTGKPSLGYFPLLLGLIVIGTIGLQIYNRVPTAPSTPILLKTSDMIQLTRFEEIANRTQTPVTLPEKLFGSSLYLIGIYPSAVKDWPANSVSLVFVKDNARFVEMDVLPNVSLEKVTPQYTAYPQETIAIGDNQKGLLIHVRSGFDCTSPKPNTVPAMCLITNMLLFEKNGTLIQLSSDGNHITQGELIEMARSIK
ncbi:hypothetical protein A3C09_02770 [Candidatus Uhrbacteria bacterium RIFCSPHIGHO2_02_FULL_47_44]|uniref:DUF4367 domain-containing protein n=1 Tax=Candidatus Uhrbacteria bacterium RIFCSPLOWO2_02_FULL_48_18 TaxID=1802408 RepID=A0A1F7V728_9BACT|nr:MAG: hypothetical protein A2839_01420 [Candidatus Uhrbacteria bacterium RIFCSPHIGHO2_01_FULL_47_10]OGL70220.1 MAG: hypothetical protein A3C09_02770 [Candidatus Uhrbacteria bacterium RIFCSPHIGHO2_02_FULL_47_44]OGL77242.1 MAG: hypothetical protein A3E97_01065 [Candidatus Uhrbacteria bacterium RIFCSPHIGHO2_12_FULL_47_12]OGL80469.1 MAG: hypothetical protein A3B20_03615 [Candidatus Uhrbacteria bacterium RIFCSPLOWO2_01_FULL_47_17]OGL86329.1 MAG: hypothetical protein A3I41_02095 [Candidatus Uhrbact